MKLTREVSWTDASTETCSYQTPTFIITMVILTIGAVNDVPLVITSMSAVVAMQSSVSGCRCDVCL